MISEKLLRPKLEIYPSDILEKIAEPVGENEICEIIENSKNISEFLLAKRGIGIAGPQLGISKRFFYILEGRKVKAVINPVILGVSSETDIMIERCLSLPGIEVPIVRHVWVDAEFVGLDGKTVVERFKGFEARVFQHEYDHLDGKLIIDHIKKQPIAIMIQK